LMIMSTTNTNTLLLTRSLLLSGSVVFGGGAF
jgi:hypothetical protein